MEQMGPEALMLTAATAGRREVAEFARLEYSGVEARRAERSLLRDFEAQPAKRSVARDLFRWGAKRLRREALGSTVASSLAVMAAAAVAAGPVGGSASLAELPAREYSRRAGWRAPISALPIADQV
jgi:hypothetical protein